MNRSRKYFALLLSAILCLSGCAAKPSEKPADIEELYVTATFYPIYALAALVTADVPDLHLSCLVQPQDGCLRGYSLSDWDLSLLMGSNAVICGGDALESFAGTLSSLGEKGPAVAEILTGVETENIEYVNLSADAESHFSGENPFVYLSADGAIELAEHIEACMAALDPKYAAEYAQNLENAREKLESLGTELRETVGDLAGKSVGILNEAFYYAAKEFSLQPLVCWARESGEDMSSEELERCTHALRSAGVKVLLIEKQAPQRLIKALTDAGFVAARLDTLSTGRAQTGAEDFFNALRGNAEAVRKAFAEAEA